MSESLSPTWPPAVGGASSASRPATGLDAPAAPLPPSLAEIRLVESDGTVITIWDADDGDPWDALRRWVESCAGGYRVVWTHPEGEVA